MYIKTTEEKKPWFGFDQAIPFESSACGKAILVGEHAVVYGSRAVALPLRQLRLNISVTPSQAGLENRWRDSQLIKHLREILREALALLELPALNLAIDGGSDLPIGAGVGSSAALCVATLKAVMGSIGQVGTAAQIAHDANILERRFHGKPSGLDTMVVAMEEGILFRRSEPARVLAAAPGKRLSFALVDSRVRAATKTMIQLASPFFHGSQGDLRIAEFDRISVDAAEALEAGDQAGLALVMDECAAKLDELGVVTDRLSDMVAICKRLGCLSAKTTGAGGGGMILALLCGDTVTEQLASLRSVFGEEQVYAFQL